MTDFPKISVVTITYGHEHYITETLDGVLMQNYPGKLEFIIANDNSPDETDEVIKRYFEKKNCPENIEIKYTKHVSNKGMMPNFIWALEQATGKYVAICEGDDYWIDPSKLRTQVDFMEANPSYVLCFTNRIVLKKNILEISKLKFAKSSFDSSKIPFIHVPTLTILFRNHVKQLPVKMRDSLIDASLFLFLSQYGSFHYSDKVTAVYRIHEQGMWNGNSELTNCTRSVGARLRAWRFCKNVDKLSLAVSLVEWIRLKKISEVHSRKYLSAAYSFSLEYYFRFYIRLNRLRKGNK